MLKVNGIIPTRFVAIASNLVLAINIIITRNLYVNLNSNEETQLLLVFGLTLAMLLIELFGLFGGISMFSTTQSLISTTCHLGAAVSLSLFTIDAWSLDSYWYIFGFTIALPCFTEIVTWIRKFIFKPGSSAQEDSRVQ